MTAQIAVLRAAGGRPTDKKDHQQRETKMTLATYGGILPCSPQQMTERRRCGYLSRRLADKPTRWQNITKANSWSVAGNMQVSQWTGQNGETRQGWQVIADSVISARTVRPGGKKINRAGYDAPEQSKTTGRE